MSKLETEIENGYLTVREQGYPTDRFEIVDHVPLGYSVWNIGSHMPEGWLPLCRLAARQPFEGAMDVDVESLKAIRCEGAQTILAAVGFGPDTIDEMRTYIKKHEGDKSKEYILERMRKALPYMRQLKWN